MVLHVSGGADEKVIERLKGCNIKFVTNSSIPAPGAYISFTEGKNKTKNISYYVIDRNGNYLVNKQTFSYKKADEGGTQLAYRLFDIGGNEVEEKKK
jgi:hypothetical protein